MAVNVSGPTAAWVAIGSNLSDPLQQVICSFAEIAALPGTRILRQSSPWRTPPVGYADQPWFYNAVMEIETELGPYALLDALLALEQQRGRVRQFRNGPRIIDLDVLLYGGLAQEDPRLILPHPRMHERAFVLYPLNEIAPDLVIPGRGRVADLLPLCDAYGIERSPVSGATA